MLLSRNIATSKIVQISVEYSQARSPTYPHRDFHGLRLRSVRRKRQTFIGSGNFRAVWISRAVVTYLSRDPRDVFLFCLSRFTLLRPLPFFSSYFVWCSFFNLNPPAFNLLPSPFPNCIIASKSVHRRFFCSLGTSCDGFQSSKIGKGLVGFWYNTDVEVAKYDSYYSTYTISAFDWSNHFLDSIES